MADVGQRVAIVTGAAGGLGAAFAVRLAGEGFDLALVDLKPCAETIEYAGVHGWRVIGIEADLTDPAAADNAVAEATSRLGRCDVLVNNAGFYSTVAFDDLSYEIWRRYMALNLDAPFLMAKACVPHMRRNRWGRIINIASNSLYHMLPGAAAYITSKGGLVGLTRALASDLGGDEITVNAVAPGPVATERFRSLFFEQAGRADDAALEGMLQHMTASQALKRRAREEDAAGVVAFLASDDAAFMTGQTLLVDGGWTRV